LEQSSSAAVTTLVPTAGSVMAAKIKDGLFIGDADTSQDPEFLELNKISNLINFSGREVSNVWAAHGRHHSIPLPFLTSPPVCSLSVSGLVYNTYNWEDRDDYKLFDAKHEILSEIVLFIDKAIRSHSFLSPPCARLPLP
jgi:hypothetical protein